MEKCEKELKDLAAILSAHADLTAMHERYIHECHEHSDPSACKNVKSIGESIADREALDDLISAFTKCIGQK